MTVGTGKLSRKIQRRKKIIEESEGCLEKDEVDCKGRAPCRQQTKDRRRATTTITISYFSHNKADLPSRVYTNEERLRLMIHALMVVIGEANLSGETLSGTTLDMLRTVVATYRFRATLSHLKQQDVDFTKYLYVPEGDPITKKIHLLIKITVELKSQLNKFTHNCHY